MSLEVTMPQMGESVVEGTVTKWLVKEGDRVSEDQPLCEISTDKVDTEIPSPGSGIIVRLIAAEGQTLPVGAPLAVIESEPAAQETPARQAEPQRHSAPSPAPLPRQAPPPPPRGETTATASGAQSATAGTVAQSSRPRRYSPVVMRMAEEHNIDLSLVPGTGIGGRVSKRDVERYLENLRSGHEASQAAAAATTVAAQPAPAAPSAYRPPVYQPREGDVVEPFSRRRKLIAEHMVYSKTHSPHVGTVAEVDLTRVMRLRERHKEEFARREGFSVTVLPIAVAATAQALREFPGLNASVVNDALVIRRQINIGVAVDTEAGLVVPVIRDADQKSVLGLAREINTLARKALAGELSADDVTGCSFTVTNPGREGNLFGFAIINQTQVGILR